MSTTLQDHPIANIFPMLQEKELAELANDIRENGLQTPIWLYEGKILDGRNRYRACGIAGVEPDWKEYTGDAPTSFVVSLNMHRRHLTPSQAAAAAVEAFPFFEQEARARQNLGQKIDEGSRGRATEKAAETFNTNRQYVSDARSIKDKAPEMFRMVQSGRLTLSEAKREIKKEEHKAKVEAASVADKSKRPTGPFSLVLSDPPWRYDFAEAANREIENHYPTATPEEIGTHKPDTTDDAILLLWATSPKLKEALYVMGAWGFEYKTHAIWDKEMVGMGYWFRGQHELLLVGTKGKPGTVPECERVSSVFRESRGRHSAKPECVYSWIERAFPDLKKLEMYCRSPREGWGVFGNEV